MLRLKDFPPLTARSQIDRASVLMVCDHAEIASIWAEILQHRHIQVVLANTAEEAHKRFTEQAPDAIVIDVNSPRLDGTELVRRIRTSSDIPILLFTPRNDEAHLLEAYQAGVDECEPKPVSPALFVAKVIVWLHRSLPLPPKNGNNLEISGLRMDAMRRHVVTCTGAIVKLSNLEFRLLYFLMQHPGWVLESENIIQSVWGYQGEGNSALLKNVILRLRRKIEPDPSHPCYIYTEPGVGYRFLQ